MIGYFEPPPCRRFSEFPFGVSLREISVAIAKAYDEAISNNRYLNQEIASRQYPRFEKLPQVRNDEANKPSIQII